MPPTHPLTISQNYLIITTFFVQKVEFQKIRAYLSQIHFLFCYVLMSKQFTLLQFKEVFFLTIKKRLTAVVAVVVEEFKNA
jgi:hypothetical protein